MTDDLEVPYDEYAEQTVAACAVASRRGAQLAAERLKPQHFWHPKYRSLFEAAVALDEESGVTEEGLASRERRVAAITGVPLPEIGRLVYDRPVQWDTSGSYARRVARGALARHVMAVCAQTYNELGAGANPGKVIASLVEEVAHLEGSAA